MDAALPDGSLVGWPCSAFFGDDDRSPMIPRAQRPCIFSRSFGVHFFCFALGRRQHLYVGMVVKLSRIRKFLLYRYALNFLIIIRTYQ